MRLSDLAPWHTLNMIEKYYDAKYLMSQLFHVLTNYIFYTTAPAPRACARALLVIFLIGEVLKVMELLESGS